MAEAAARDLHRAGHRADCRRGLRGFRLAAGGAQEYFGVRADMVTYGKSLAGGFLIGVVCGRKGLMRRFRDDRPADVFERALRTCTCPRPGSINSPSSNTAALCSIV